VKTGINVNYYLAVDKICSNQALSLYEILVTDIKGL